MRTLAKFFFITVLGSSVAYADERRNGGDLTVQDFVNAISSAHSMIERGPPKKLVFFSELPKDLTRHESIDGILNWYDSQYENLLDDVKNMRLEFDLTKFKEKAGDGRQNHCAITTRAPSALVYINLTNCNARVKSPEDAARVLVGEALHHRSTLPWSDDLDDQFVAWMSWQIFKTSSEVHATSNRDNTKVWSKLETAVIGANIPLVKRLLKENPNLDLNDFGKNHNLLAIAAAISADREKTAEIYEKIIDLLLEAGADVDASDIFGKNAFSAFKQNGHLNHKSSLKHLASSTAKKFIERTVTRQSHLSELCFFSLRQDNVDMATSYCTPDLSEDERNYALGVALKHSSEENIALAHSIATVASYQPEGFLTNYKLKTIDPILKLDLIKETINTTSYFEEWIPGLYARGSYLHLLLSFYNRESDLRHMDKIEALLKAGANPFVRNYDSEDAFYIFFKGDDTPTEDNTVYPAVSYTIQRLPTLEKLRFVNTILERLANAVPENGVRPSVDDSLTQTRLSTRFWIYFWYDLLRKLEQYYPESEKTLSKSYRNELGRAYVAYTRLGYNSVGNGCVTFGFRYQKSNYSYRSNEIGRFTSVPKEFKEGLTPLTTYGLAMTAIGARGNITIKPNDTYVCGQDDRIELRMRSH